MFEWITKGGPVMLPLLGCSLVSLTIIFERVWFWMRVRYHRAPEMAAKVLNLIENGKYSLALEESDGHADYIVRAIHRVLEHHSFSLESVLGLAAGQEQRRMNHYMDILDTIITVAPLLGILGTVIGIISSFDILGATGIEHPRAVTGGIAQALLTTAFGLSIAIITIIPYNYFQTRIDDATNELEMQLTNFEIVYRKGKQRI